MLIGGNFNARTGEEGGPIRDGEEEGKSLKRPKDKIVNREGKILIDRISERG